MALPMPAVMVLSRHHRNRQPFDVIASRGCFISESFRRGADSMIASITLCVEQLGMPAARTLFVDDTACNGNSAIDAGLQG
ncbi:hypothetical protein ACFFYR_30460 [Paraburkholderia dipogonis]|uniref:hypothetical protein n=1 Tax=Paraburkholderia dipogonis TaxID=1211383 RepID=UPI0035E8B591